MTTSFVSCQDTTLPSTPTSVAGPLCFPLSFVTGDKVSEKGSPPGLLCCPVVLWHHHRVAVLAPRRTKLSTVSLGQSLGQVPFVSLVGTSHWFGWGTPTLMLQRPLTPPGSGCEALNKTPSLHLSFLLCKWGIRRSLWAEASNCSLTTAWSDRRARGQLMTQWAGMKQQTESWRVQVTLGWALRSTGVCQEEEHRWPSR